MSRLANTLAGTVAAVPTLGDSTVSGASSERIGANPGIVGKSSASRGIV